MAQHDGCRNANSRLASRDTKSEQTPSVDPPPVMVSGQTSTFRTTSRSLISAGVMVEGAAAQEDDTKLTQVALHNAPPWLVSLIVHMLTVICLGLWVFAPTRNRGIEIEAVFAEDHGDQILDEPMPLEVVDPEEVESVVVEKALPEVSDPFAAPPEVEVVLDGVMATSDRMPSITSITAFDGRQEGSKEALLAAYGGTAQSEAAVVAGLKWLAKQQNADGTWSLQGPYSAGAGVENFAAATSMALLAFQGAGHTHQSRHPFKKNVERGIQALLPIQNEDGCFFDEQYGRNNHRFYTHAQATIAVCELYAMTRDEQLREPAQRAIDYCVENQDPQRGGWRYHPQQDSDTSVTGWVVMALQSGRMAGLNVPQGTFDRVMGYLDQVSEEDGSRYAYHAGSTSDETMTAEALLCRQYLGWARDDERLVRGIDYLLQAKNLPVWKEPDRNVYFWYYATQVMHHMEGDYWERWNGVVRDLLVEHQVLNGREKGSWNPMLPVADRWGHHGGRLFVTCLSIYVLEVYYRHLPLYSKKFGWTTAG